MLHTTPAPPAISKLFLSRLPWLFHLTSLAHLGWFYLDHELFREGNLCCCRALQHRLLFRWDLRATRAESIHQDHKHLYRQCKHSISPLWAKFWKKPSTTSSSTLGEDLFLTVLLKDRWKASLCSVGKETPRLAGIIREVSAQWHGTWTHWDRTSWKPSKVGKRLPAPSWKSCARAQSPKSRLPRPRTTASAEASGKHKGALYRGDPKTTPRPLRTPENLLVGYTK